MFCLIDILNEVVKFVIFLEILSFFFCVLIFNGIVLVLEWDVNVKVSIGNIFFKYWIGFKLDNVINNKWMINIMISVM